MIKDPKQLKPGQYIVASGSLHWTAKPGTKRIRSGRIGKQISGIPRPGVMIHWDDGITALLPFSTSDGWWSTSTVVNTEQEKLALIMKLS
jgi:hypothetical protein